MASLIEKFRNIPVHMDFDGQRRAERIFQTIISVFAAVGLIIGYVFQQFSYTVYTLGAGFILSCIYHQILKVMLTSTDLQQMFLPVSECLHTVVWEDLAYALTLPPWPMYRRKPLNWQKPREEGQESSKSKKKK